MLEPKKFKMLTIAEVATAIGVTRGRVYQLLKEQKMRGEKIGTVWLVPETEIARFRAPSKVGRPRSYRSSPLC